MSQEAATAKLPEITLTYFLWLPAGKDEFGFDDYGSAPLSETAFYRVAEPLENTISHHFEDRVAQLTSDENKLAYLVPHESLRPTDGELGLRKIHFGFTYNHSYPELRRFLRDEPIPGTAIFLSNGLYMWSFRIPLRPDVTEQQRPDLRKALQGFLRHDFVPRHLSHLFKFSWNPADAGGRPDDYGGILTYYQMDLLFNGAFDASAHPHLVFEENSPNGQLSASSPVRRARERYGIRYLIESLSLYAVDDEYVPLFDLRKAYTLRRTHGDDAAYVGSDLDFSERSLRADDEDGLKQRELLLARLSFAAMEQFLRVAISFGLTYYKAGLDHVRSELVSQGMQSRKNRPSAELRRPSLRNLPLMLADLENYHAQLVGKVPVLTFLAELIYGLSEVTKPSKEVKENGVPGAIEYKYARSTLEEARTQFARMVNAISADLQAIESTLASVRTDQMILELSEARKLTEIASESPRGEVQVAGGTITIEADGKLALFFGLLGALIGVTELFSNAGVWLIQSLLGSNFHPTRLLVSLFWGAGLAIIGLAFLLGWRGITRMRSAQQRRAESVNGRLETHVFDYPSLLREVEGASGTSGPLMADLRQSMVDIERPQGPGVKCAAFSTFHETPSTGVERIKYSLESPPGKNETSYILHIEFDRRLSGSGRERLLDIRLVVRNSTNTKLDVIANSHRVIADCVKRILFPDGTEGDLKNFCLQRFGWDPTPSQQGLQS